MKTLAKLMLTAALSLFILGSLSAQDANVKDNVKTTTGTSVTPGKFVDNNNDGICDNAVARGNSGQGRNFVDKDGDGVCDNWKTTNCKGKKGCCGYGRNHGGKGQGLRLRDGSCLRNAADKNANQPKTK